MVVASEPLAAEAGVEILRAGGNAVDAAVAVGFSLAVTHPQAGNLGGGGFMLIRLASGEATVVDYREQAPGAAHRDMYLDASGEPISEASIVGARAVAVPGTVAGLALAHRRYGRLKWRRVLAPAIRLARKGFPVSFSLARSLRDHQERLARFPETKRIFLRDGRPYEPGEAFRQPELARTLREIARRGPQVFYSGRIAEQIAETMREHGGLLTLDDLHAYEPKLREPLRGSFRGYEILSVPSPSSGGILLIQMLNVLEPVELGPPLSFQSMRLMTETMRRAFADRAAFLGDADFVSVPVEQLTSKQYAAQRREEILRGEARTEVRPGKPEMLEPENTTHFSIVDSAGNAVANTTTLNDSYGSGVTVRGAGFLLNNEMDDFTVKPGRPNLYGLVQSEANAIAPRKRPLSAMTPTIALRDGRVRLVLGSPGGPTIINTVLQVMLNVLAFGMDVRQAVTAPRFHHQWLPGRLRIEAWGFSADTVERLRAAGYDIEVRPPIGSCEAIERNPTTGWLLGAADPRGEGKAVGY